MVIQRLFDNGAKVKEVVSLLVILAVDLVVFSTFAVSVPTMLGSGSS